MGSLRQRPYTFPSLLVLPNFPLVPLTFRVQTLALFTLQASQFLHRQSWKFWKNEEQKEKEKAEEKDEDVVETMCEQAEREYREPSETLHEKNPYFKVNLAKRNHLLAKILFVLFINPTFSDRIHHINVGILKLVNGGIQKIGSRLNWIHEITCQNNKFAISLF